MQVIKYIFIAIFIGILSSAQAQNKDKLRLQSNIFSNKFYKGDTLISVNQVLYEMAPNESVYNLMKSAKKDFVFAQILGATGGVLIGWPIGTALAGGDPNWVLAGVGVGVLAISVPISVNFKNKALSAISKHNSLLTGSRKSNFRPKSYLGFNGSGLHFSIRF